MGIDSKGVQASLISKYNLKDEDCVRYVVNGPHMDSMAYSDNSIECFGTMPNAVEQGWFYVGEEGLLEYELELHLEVGDEVFWDDPDQGICSGYYKVKAKLTDEVYLIGNEAGSETQVYKQELR